MAFLPRAVRNDLAVALSGRHASSHGSVDRMNVGARQCASLHTRTLLLGNKERRTDQ